MLWSQRRNSGAHGAENSIQISALAGVELRTWASSDVATRLPRTPPFSHLLRHAGGYSRTILTPNLQGVFFTGYRVPGIKTVFTGSGYLVPSILKIRKSGRKVSLVFVLIFLFRQLSMQHEKSLRNKF